MPDIVATVPRTLEGLQGQSQSQVCSLIIYTNNDSRYFGLLRMVALILVTLTLAYAAVGALG